MKAYILMIDKPISIEYAKTASASCAKVGLDWEFFEGYCDMPGYEAWWKTGLNLSKFTINDIPKSKHGKISPPACASAGHAAIWKRIAEGHDDVGVVLEHDALMLHPLTIDIPDNMIAVLGYKLHDPKRYDYRKAGPPKKLVSITTHQGAHAYAITKNTAQILVNEIESNGKPLGNIDQHYFIKSRSKVPLSIVDPTPVIGWARKTTVWNRDHAYAPNAAFIQSFKENLK